MTEPRWVKFRGGKWHRASRSYGDRPWQLWCKGRSWWYRDSDFEAIAERPPTGEPTCQQIACLKAYRLTRN